MRRVNQRLGGNSPISLASSSSSVGGVENQLLMKIREWGIFMFSMKELVGESGRD